VPSKNTGLLYSDKFHRVFGKYQMSINIPLRKEESSYFLHELCKSEKGLMSTYGCKISSHIRSMCKNLHSYTSRLTYVYVHYIV
jgi:hypothetical protein